MLIDEHGRRMRKLRLSITEACNFHCFYCMPGKSPPLHDPRALDAEGYARIIEPLVKAGIEQVRITGGEPLLRPEFRSIVARLSHIEGLHLSVTTNASLLIREIDYLWDQGVRKLNISMDSLDEGNFNKITGRHLPPVLAAIHSAKMKGFHVKINMVVSRGINDHELLDFVDFAEEEQLEVRFLEMMQIGPARHQHSALFMDADSMEERIRMRYSLNAIESENDSTVYRFHTPRQAVIGFMASESKPFCGSCSRLRMSARGELRACLMKTDSVALAHLSESNMLTAVLNLLHKKPMDRVDSLMQAMHQIGG